MYAWVNYFYFFILTPVKEPSVIRDKEFGVTTGHAVRGIPHAQVSYYTEFLKRGWRRCLCFKCFSLHVFRNMNKRESLLVVTQEENKAKIQSILEHLCGDDSKLEIYQKDHSKEMIISGECVEGLSFCQTTIKNAKHYTTIFNISKLFLNLQWVQGKVDCGYCFVFLIMQVMSKE